MLADKRIKMGAGTFLGNQSNNEMPLQTSRIGQESSIDNIETVDWIFDGKEFIGARPDNPSTVVKGGTTVPKKVASRTRP